MCHHLDLNKYASPYTELLTLSYYYEKVLVIFQAIYSAGGINSYRTIIFEGKNLKKSLYYLAIDQHQIIQQTI